MSHADLLDALRTIHDELEAGENLDAEEVAKLKVTVREIEAALERQQPEETDFNDRLGASASYFEDTHPRLKLTLGRIADMLQQMGF